MRWMVLLLFVLLIGALSYWSRPVPLPVPVVRTRVDLADGGRCAECHQELFDSLTSAPHFKTLTPANAPTMLDRFAGHGYTWPEPGPRIQFVEEAGQLWMHSEAYPQPLRVDWIFGSGTHAQTPVSLRQNAEGRVESIQHRVSWYPQTGLGPTLEMSQGRDPTLGISAIGDRTGHADTLECFGCHVTSLWSGAGTITPDQVVAGVRCVRCHAGGEAHIASVEADGPTAMEDWNDLTPLESINRCGECHRRADQLMPVDLDPERLVLVRFAPVGLAMSRCFQQQNETALRLDCLTCHNPHRAAERDPAYYVAKCLSCHSSEATGAADCTVEPMTSNCLTCHMPGVEVEQDLRFTDHWIRIRRTPPARQSLPHAP